MKFVHRRLSQISALEWSEKVGDQEVSPVYHTKEDYYQNVIQGDEGHYNAYFSKICMSSFFAFWRSSLIILMS